jgi:hypothetical protein
MDMIIMGEDSFAQFLCELRAERKSKTFDQMSDRLIAERDLRRYFTELKEKKFTIQENLDISLDFDFLIRKGDTELIGLLEYNENGFKITLEKLRELDRILSKNPQSQAVMLIWIIRPHYPSLVLRPDVLNKELRDGKVEYDFASTVKPLRDSIDFFFKESERLISGGLQQGINVQQAEQMRLFEVINRILMEEYNEIKKKRFRTDYKIKAVQELSIDDLKLIENIFRKALEKKLEKDSIERLLKEATKAKH